MRFSTPFFISSSFLNYEIKNLLMIGDVFDFLTPFVFVFMVYRIYLLLLPHTGKIRILL